LIQKSERTSGSLERSEEWNCAFISGFCGSPGLASLQHRPSGRKRTVVQGTMVSTLSVAKFVGSQLEIAVMRRLCE